MMAICGTGMGSLAGLLQKQGYTVAGSDVHVYPPMSVQLDSLGIPVFSPYRAENLVQFAPDLVIVGNAISRGNPEAQQLLQSGIPYLSMPQALNRFFLAGKEVIVVAGTHGKTTTTAIMAFLLSRLGCDPSYLMGGVPKNFPRSFHIGSGKYFVIEGDEYDTAFFDKGPKFLHYNPRHVIMTSLEFDHADIYRDVDQIASSFNQLAKIIPSQGSLHVCDEYPRLTEVASHCQAPVRFYGTQALSWHIENLITRENETSFSLVSNGRELAPIHSPLVGLYNAQNVAACFSVLHTLGLDLKLAAQHLPDFESVKRRQDVLFDDGHVAVLDDFAHHPTAVAKTIEAIRQKFPGRMHIAVFEPRSNTSRRKVFQQEFARSFSQADAVMLAEVFMPEKVPEAERLDVAQLVADIAQSGKPAHLLQDAAAIIQELLKQVSTSTRPITILFMSNGGFDNIHRRFIDAYKNLAAKPG